MSVTTKDPHDDGDEAPSRPAQYEQLALPIELAEPEFDDEGSGEEHSGAQAQR